MFQKIFLLVKFFNWISCNKSLRPKFHVFCRVFFCLPPPWGWNVLEGERLLHSWCHMGWRDTKICIHGASWMERKCGKCWKLPIFERKLQVFSIIWVKWKQPVSSITLLYSSTFYSLFLPFFILEIFKFKYDKFFCQKFCFISKFIWFEQLWTNTETFMFQAVLVFNLLSRKVLFINRKDNKNC